MRPIPSWTTTARIITDENPATMIPTWKTSVHTTAFRPPCMRNSGYQIQKGSSTLALHPHSTKRNVTIRIMHNRLISSSSLIEIILYWSVQELHPGTYSGHPGPFWKCTRISFGHTHSLIQYFLHHITWFRSLYQKKNWQTVLILHTYTVPLTLEGIPFIWIKIHTI